MNITTYIQDALTAFNYDAEVFLFTKVRAANEELEHTQPVIIVFPDWTTQTILTQGFELVKTRRYNIEFKQLDEWDNADNDSTDYGYSTVEKIEEMEKLADSIFSYISINIGSKYPEIRKKLSWRAVKPIVRERSGTMSGVVIQLELVFTGARICPTT